MARRLTKQPDVYRTVGRSIHSIGRPMVVGCRDLLIGSRGCWTG